MSTTERISANLPQSEIKAADTGKIAHPRKMMLKITQIVLYMKRHKKRHMRTSKSMIELKRQTVIKKNHLVKMMIAKKFLMKRGRLIVINLADTIGTGEMRRSKKSLMKEGTLIVRNLADTKGTDERRGVTMKVDMMIAGRKIPSMKSTEM